MKHDTLNGLRVAILAADRFEQSEMIEPRKALDETGAETTVVSPKHGSIRSWNHKEWGREVGVDEDLKGADRKDYDALLLPGGVMNADASRMDPGADIRNAGANWVDQGAVLAGKLVRSRKPGDIPPSTARSSNSLPGRTSAPTPERARMRPAGALARGSRAGYRQVGGSRRDRLRCVPAR